MSGQGGPRDEVPKALAETVWWDGDALCLWVRATPPRIQLARQITVLTGLLAIAVTVGTLLFATPLLAAWALLLVGVWTWALWGQPRHHRIARIGPGGFELTAPFAVRDGAPDRVVVMGAVGRKCELYVGQRRLLDVEMDASEGWTPRSLTWFAHALGRILDVPVEDHRPLAQWKKWQDDGLYRAAVRFDLALEENRRQFLRYHSQPAVPMQGEMDHHGMRIPIRRGGIFENDLTVVVDHETVRCGDNVIRLADIVRVGWFARRAEGSAHPTRLSLHVLTPTRWVRLFSVGGERVHQRWPGGLSWLAQTLMAHAEAARERQPVERGDAADVPRELQALQAKRARERQ